MTVLGIDTSIRRDEIKATNKKLTEVALDLANKTHMARMVKRDVGIISAEPDSLELKTYIEQLEVEIANPSSDLIYQPPLPPGVPPPDIAAITALITREPGWNNTLGYRIVLTLSDPTYVPANIALAIYTAADCVGYRFTTGAFQYDSVNDKYFSVCPAGFEPGDANVHMGLLYGAAQLSCFTLPAGETTKEVLVYSQEV